MLPSPPSEMNYLPASKRKRGDLVAEEQSDQTFTVTNLVSNVQLSFEPVNRLLRAHLPLSWLATTDGICSSNITPGSLLEGHIKNISGWDYAVLVARHVPNGGLVAIEKVEGSYHVVHPLQPFVSEKWVQDAYIGASPSVSLQMMLHYIPTSGTDSEFGSRRTPGPNSEQILNIPKNRKGAAARLSILSLPGKIEDGMLSPQGESSPVVIKETAPSMLVEEPERTLSSFLLNGQLSVTEGAVAIAPEPQTDMLSPAYLRQRYLDHLYTTKTSLAYYTKGPLSRARARARAQDSSMTLTDLATFYRDSMLPTKRMDIKYKESIQQVVREQELPVSATTKKPSRKTKLGKNGLWPMEHEFVQRWWKARSLASHPTLDQQAREMRDAIASLRMREAQMQMVLIVEVLSIELKQRDVVQESKLVPEDADVKVESVEDIVVPEASKAKPKKQRNLEADVELLADRLCIWHSVGLEGIMFSADDANGEDKGTQIESKDQLRNFCVDVLIPFYSSKLPLLCKSLCRTLAGSEIYEQAQKASRLRDASKAVPPGTIVGTRFPSGTGKDLERIVSEEGMRQASPPALVRSSTLPPLPKFRREASELSQRPASRNSRQLSVNLTNREIDLTADAQATAFKKRKLDRVASHKQELAAAIEALKKPNRRTVSSAYMDEAERRKPDIVPDLVQITATPKGNRRTQLDDMIVEPLTRPVFDRDQFVPSSGMKPKSAILFGTASRSSSKKKAVLAAIHDTPSKGVNGRTNRTQGIMEVTADTSPDFGVGTSEAVVLSTPSKPRSRMSERAGSSGGQENSFELPDIAVQAMDRAMEMPLASTIYDTLGWNDDDDDS